MKSRKSISIRRQSMQEQLSTVAHTKSESKALILVNDLEIAPPSVVESDKKTRLLISFSISATDLGLESVYHELCEINLPIDRVMHIKQILFDGQASPVKNSRLQKKLVPSRSGSFKIAFSVTPRDVGLRWLFNQLTNLGNAFARNQHVRRLLYQACMEPVAQVNPLSQSSSISSPSLPGSEQNSGIELVGFEKPLSEVDEQMAARSAKRLKQLKQNVIMLGTSIVPNASQ